MWQKLVHFLSEDLWNFSLDQKKGAKRFWLRVLRIVVLSVRNFYYDQCTTHASSLTLYTLMSIVPLAAMSFAIAQGFDYADYLKSQIYLNFPEQKAALDAIFPLADRFLATAQEGILAAFAVLFLLWSAWFLLSSMEEAFNHVWGVSSTRSWQRMISDYLALMILTPMFFALMGSLILVVESHLPPALGPIVEMASYLVVWVFFTFLYLFIPNTKVRFLPALVGGAAAGILFFIGQVGYLYFQAHATQYGALYGSFAALPLFLVWVQLSWFILLFGVELCQSCQRGDEHEFEPMIARTGYGLKLVVALYIAHLVFSRSDKRESPITLDLLVHRYHVPHLLATPLLQELVRAQLIVETEAGYVPGAHADTLRLSDAMQALQNWEQSDLPFLASREFTRLTQALASFHASIAQNPENLLLTHLGPPRA